MPVDRLNSEALKDILSMNRTPREEAIYLLNLYEGEAASVAADVLATFKTMNRPDLVKYWEEVGTCLKQARH
jgi:hypothetical protein